MPETAATGLDRLLERAEELARSLEQHPNPAVREDVSELLQIVDVLHRDAIQRLSSLLVLAGNKEALEEAIRDPQIVALLQLYDVMPLPQLVEWQEALDAVRPELARRGATIHISTFTEGMPHLQLKGGFEASLEPELREAVEREIASAFNGARSMKWEARELPPRPPGFVAAAELQPAKQQHWIDLCDSNDLQPGRMLALEVEKNALLLCRVGDQFQAFPNACPGSALPLHLGRIVGDTLQCPWHGCVFNLLSGKRTSGSGQDLRPFTIRIENGRVQLSLWR